MKKITMQEFANLFDVFVTKDFHGGVHCYEKKPRLKDGVWISDSTYTWIITTWITTLISDAEEHDYTVLVSPQEKTFSETPTSIPNTNKEEITVIEVLKDISSTLNYIYERLCK